MDNSKEIKWLRLEDSFFTERQIKKMRRLKNGGDNIITYQKLMLLSMNSDGYLIFAGIEESMFEQLSLEIDESEELIKETIDFCIKNGLLKIDGDKYFLNKVLELVACEDCFCTGD